MKRLFPLIFISLFACQKEVLRPSSINAQTSSDSKISQTIPFEFYSFNECTQEWVFFTGEYQIDYRSNGTHEGGQLQHKNTIGIGQTTGREYKIVGQSNNNSTTTGNGFNFSIHTSITLSTPGAKNDWVVSYRAMIVANSTGLVVLRDEFAEFCK